MRGGLTLRPPSPHSYCHYLLGQVYEESKSRPREDVLYHYRRALERFDAVYDPLDTRFYAVTKEMIRERLIALGENEASLPQAH